jgi:hypothetical protein
MVWVVLVGCQGGGGEPPVPSPEPVRPPELKSPGVIPAAPLGPDDPPPTVSDANCGDLADGGPVAGPGCITATVKCGETIAGHTKGGTSTFDTRFYEAKYCTPATTDHDSGDERVYALTMPDGNHRAQVWLDTPCADLDLAAVRVPGFESCPTLDTPVAQCEMNQKTRTQREKVELVSQGPTTWLLVVEGKGDAEGAFGLTVKCVDGL